MYSTNLKPRWAEGRSLDEVKEKLFQKYEDDYDILDYKTIIRSGFLNLNPHEVFQVKYVVKDNRFEDAPRLAAGGTRPLSPAPSAASAGGVGAAGPMGARGQQHASSGSVPPSGYAALPPQAAARSQFDSAKKAVLESLGVTDSVASQVKLNDKINDMSKQLKDMSFLLSKMSESAAVKDDQPALAKVASLLEQNGFSRAYIGEMKSRIRGEFKLEELDDEKLVMDQVVDWIGEDVSVAPRFAGKKNPHVIVVVGPTGVGKTTTIAKMVAEIMTAKKGRKPVIHMITTDNMRVAAKEQIDRYAEVMGLKVEKVDTKEDLENLLGVYNGSKSQVDFVFIDTSGFSPNDYDHISKLQEMLSVRNLNADIYLAVSATTKARDLEKIFQNYEAFGFRSVIVTKCDETMTYGNVLSVLHEKRKPVSWITVGQEILHTMERADPVYFLRNLDGFVVDRNHLERKFGKDDLSPSAGLGE